VEGDRLTGDKGQIPEGDDEGTPSARAETDYLMSIPGMLECIRDGMKEPLEADSPDPRWDLPDDLDV
jgi:hypothetical protein